MIEISFKYTTDRTQFGKPIGSFQAVKHHLADVVTKIEFAKPVLYRAVAALVGAESDLAVRVGDTLFALRRAEARCIEMLRARPPRCRRPRRWRWRRSCTSVG